MTLSACQPRPIQVPASSKAPLSQSLSLCCPHRRGARGPPDYHPHTSKLQTVAFCWHSRNELSRKDPRTRTGWETELILIKSVKCTRLCLCSGRSGDSCCARLFFWDSELETASLPGLRRSSLPRPCLRQQRPLGPFPRRSRVRFGFLLLPLVLH